MSINKTKKLRNYDKFWFGEEERKKNYGTSRKVMNVGKISCRITTRRNTSEGNCHQEGDTRKKWGKGIQLMADTCGLPLC